MTVVRMGPGRLQRRHVHLKGRDVVLGCTDASCLDVKSLCGPSVGAFGPGLSIANVEVDDPDDEANQSEDDEHEKQCFCVERERGVLFIPHPVLGLVVDHLIQVHGHKIIVVLLCFPLFQFILAVIFLLRCTHGARDVTEVGEDSWGYGRNGDFLLP